MSFRKLQSALSEAGLTASAANEIARILMNTSSVRKMGPIEQDLTSNDLRSLTADKKPISSLTLTFFKRRQSRQQAHTTKLHPRTQFDQHQSLLYRKAVPLNNQTHRLQSSPEISLKPRAKETKYLLV